MGRGGVFVFGVTPCAVAMGSSRAIDVAGVKPASSAAAYHRTV
jgi:hypothetical protein